MGTRLFALGAGLFYAILGALSFIPHALWSPERTQVWMERHILHGGYLGGFIPVNWLLAILWLLIGIAGIAAFSAMPYARAYARGLFALTCALAMIGLLPLGIGWLWGYLPLSQWNVLIHGFTAMLAWYFGFVYPYGRERHIVQ